MDYRVIIRWFATGEVNEKYYEDMEALYAETYVLDCAIENGAKVGYIIQRKFSTGRICEVDSMGESVGDWQNLSWKE